MTEDTATHRMHYEHNVLTHAKVWRDTFSKVHLEVDKCTAHNNVKVVSPFPLSAPHSCVVFEDSEFVSDTSREQKKDEQ